MLGILPMLLAGDGIAGVGRLGESAIMLIFPLPLACALRFGLLGIARVVGPRTIAAILSILVHYFEPVPREKPGGIAAGLSGGGDERR